MPWSLFGARSDFRGSDLWDLNNGRSKCSGEAGDVPARPMLGMLRQPNDPSEVEAAGRIDTGDVKRGYWCIKTTKGQGEGNERSLKHDTGDVSNNNGPS